MRHERLKGKARSSRCSSGLASPPTVSVRWRNRKQNLQLVRDDIFTTDAERRREQYPGSAMGRPEWCLERELDALRQDGAAYLLLQKPEWSGPIPFGR